jgi:ABC-type Fe3+-siderophore transport system permease subunit
MSAGVSVLMVMSDRLSAPAVAVRPAQRRRFGERLGTAHHPDALVVLGLAIALPYGRTLNAFALGEEGAAYVGVDVERQKAFIVVIATWLTAMAVTISGLVAFVGLLVPHTLRLVLGPDHRLLLPGSALGGAAFVVLMDTLARYAVGS